MFFFQRCLFFMSQFFSYKIAISNSSSHMFPQYSSFIDDINAFSLPDGNLNTLVSVKLNNDSSNKHIVSPASDIAPDTSLSSNMSPQSNYSIQSPIIPQTSIQPCVRPTRQKVLPANSDYIGIASTVQKQCVKTAPSTV